MENDYMKEDPIELGKKILLLIDEVKQNPNIFNIQHNAELKLCGDDADEIHISKTGRVLFSILNNNEENHSYYHNMFYKSCPYDILIFTPNSTYTKELVITDHNNKNIKNYDFLDKDYSEEELFQMSTVLDSVHMNIIQLFLYLKEHCKYILKLNFSEVDINAAILAYGWVE